MRLWKRASGALKDRNSILVASLSRRTVFRNPDIEAAVIKATSHDESHVDYRNAQRVFTWIRMSSAYLTPFTWALSMRMEKTRSWAVALKGLMLMHGVFCCKVPAVHRMGRLPFDLSNFNDGHSSRQKMWGYNAFVRAYYAFLDQKSALMCLDSQARTKGVLIEEQRQKCNQQRPMLQELSWLQKMQELLDMLLQIKPLAVGMTRFLILEAMDCVIIEIYDIYSRICNGIAKILGRIYSAGKVEALMALQILQKATVQGEDLCFYFEFCREMGVFKALECPKVEKIPEEGIRELERIVAGVSVETEKETQKMNGQKDLKTIVTDKWEVFDEDLIRISEDICFDSVEKSRKEEDPLAATLIPVVDHHPNRNTHHELPDLISFV